MAGEADMCSDGERSISGNRPTMENPARTDDEGERQARPSAGIHTSVLFFCVLVGLLIGTGVGSAAPQPGLTSPSALIEGHFGDYRWGVVVENDRGRKGVCMLVAILRRSGTGPGENGQCSAPALRRGNTRSVSLHKGGGIALTVFGAAFDRRVVKVQAIMLNGKVKVLPFRSPRPDEDGPSLSRFRYVALAVRGPWCIAELVTRDRAGTAMWRAAGGELLAYSPKRRCQGR